MISKEQINFLVDTIAKKFNPLKIFLFGSYAYGNPAADSDLDVCVVTRLDGKRKIDLIRAIRKEIGSQFQIPLDILVYDDSEFHQRAALPNTLEYKISKQGILVNG